MLKEDNYYCPDEKDNDLQMREVNYMKSNRNPAKRPVSEARSRRGGRSEKGFGRGIILAVILILAGAGAVLAVKNRFGGIKQEPTLQSGRQDAVEDASDQVGNTGLDAGYICHLIRKILVGSNNFGSVS